jgi:hypothetical protein
MSQSKRSKMKITDQKIFSEVDERVDEIRCILTESAGKKMTSLFFDPSDPSFVTRFKIYLQNFRYTLKMEGTSQFLKGINYGDYSFESDSLVATKDGKLLFKIPLSRISNSTVVNKQDVTLELQPDENDKYKAYHSNLN